MVFGRLGAFPDVPRLFSLNFYQQLNRVCKSHEEHGASGEISWIWGPFIIAHNTTQRREGSELTRPLSTDTKWSLRFADELRTDWVNWTEQLTLEVTCHSPKVTHFQRDLHTLLERYTRLEILPAGVGGVCFQCHSDAAPVCHLVNGEVLHGFVWGIVAQW